MADMMSLNIDKSMLTPVIEQQVKLLMAEIMGGQDVIITKVIEQVLKTKVDENGKPSSYSSGKPFFEYLLIEEIKKVVMDLLQEEMKSQSGKIKTALKSYLQSKTGAEELSNALIKGFLETTNDRWRAHFKIELETPKSY